MKLLQYANFKNAKELLKEKDQYKEIINVLSNDDLNIQAMNHTESKKIIVESFLENGWAYHPLVFQNMSSYMDIVNQNSLIHIQFGHNAQLYFNVLCASTMFHNGTIDVATFIVPGGTYSYGNRVNFDKFIQQYEDFDKFLLVPLLVLEVE
jgi:hypothetical protein